MTPPAANLDLEVRSVEHQVTPRVRTKAESGSRLKEPLISSGSLEKYKHASVTPTIGEEFMELQLSEILIDDNKIRDLAILGKSHLLSTAYFKPTDYHYSLSTRGCFLPKPGPEHR
jgi:hypothetical protein